MDSDTHTIEARGRGYSPACPSVLERWAVFQGLGDRLQALPGVDQLFQLLRQGQASAVQIRLALVQFGGPAREPGSLRPQVFRLGALLGVTPGELPGARFAEGLESG